MEIHVEKIYIFASEIVGLKIMNIFKVLIHIYCQVPV